MRNDFETGYLMHWGIKKGGKKENHKYYERVEKNGKYLYFYTQAEYEAWLHKGNKALDKTKNKAKGALSSLKSKFSNTKSSLLNAIGQGKSAAYQLANRSQTMLTKNNVNKIINKGQNIVDSVINKTSKTTSQAKNITEKTSKKIQNYTSKGNSVINKILNSPKSKNTKLGSSQSKTYEKKGNNVIQKAVKAVKDFWDYDITGKGYVRNAWEGYKKASDAFDNANKYENYSKRTDEENRQAWRDYYAEEARAKDNEKTQKAYYRNALIPRIKKAAENFQENVAYTVSKGERKIAQFLRNTKDGAINALEKSDDERDHYYSMDSTLKEVGAKYGKAGSGIISSILMTAAAAVVVTAAKYVIANREEIAEKAKEVFDKIFPPKEDKTKSKNKVTEVPPKDFASDTPSSYKEDRAAHSDVPQKKEPTTRDEDMAAINPNFIPEEARQELSKIESDYYKAVLTGNEEKAEELYDEYMAISEKYEGYMQNCANCTLAYDLRRRGYDVDASWNPNSTNIDAIMDWYKLTDNDVLGVDKGGQKISRSEAKQIEKQLKSMYPEGSYGHMLLYWADGGGHDVVWSIENGKTIIRDCQSNEVVNIEDYLTKCSAMDMFRADDKELTEKAYKVAVADKANLYGDADNDSDYDNDWSNHDLYADNGKTQIKTDQDLNYDKYWKNAAGKRKKR